MVNLKELDAWCASSNEINEEDIKYMRGCQMVNLQLISKWNE